MKACKARKREKVGSIALGRRTIEASNGEVRLAKLEAQLQALLTQSGSHQARLDALASKRADPPDRVGPIISGTGAAASSLIAVTGFGVVHWLSVRRQRRDEFFKRAQECLTIAERIGREASKIWRRSGDDKEAQASLELLQADIDALTHRLTLMQRLKPQFTVSTALIELKREATLDVEGAGRLADAPRADRVLRLAQGLARAVLEKYDDVYG